MSEVRISLSNGRTFEWVGDRGQGLCVINAMESAAKKGGVTFDVLTHPASNTSWGEPRSTRNRPTSFRPSSRSSCRAKQATEDPGRFVDYLDNTDFKFEIVGDGEHFDIVADATTRLHS
jgi:hypothetical protein